jgi:hypothetical protein
LKLLRVRSRTSGRLFSRAHDSPSPPLPEGEAVRKAEVIVSRAMHRVRVPSAEREETILSPEKQCQEITVTRERKTFYGRLKIINAGFLLRTLRLSTSSASKSECVGTQAFDAENAETRRELRDPQRTPRKSKINLNQSLRNLPIRSKTVSSTSSLGR